MQPSGKHAIDAASAARSPVFSVAGPPSPMILPASKPEWAVSRALGVLAAALALWFNLFVPPGFMIDRSAEGAARIVICSGYGPVAMATSGSGERHHGRQDGDGTQRSCPFAAHAAPVLGPPPPPLLGPERLFEVRTALALLLISIPSRGLAAPPPPSHAPPAPAI